MSIIKTYTETLDVYFALTKKMDFMYDFNDLGRAPGSSPKYSQFDPAAL